VYDVLRRRSSRQAVHPAYEADRERTQFHPRHSVCRRPGWTQRRPVATPRAAERPADPADAVERPRAPGLLLGIGLGGFVDGIVLHQILQWHHLLSSESEHPKTTVAGLQDNTLADGTTDWRWAISGTAFLGWILVGWGLFNLVEGIINHEILGIHHVREGAGHQTAYDLGFLAFGALLVFGGWLLTRLGERAETG